MNKSGQGQPQLMSTTIWYHDACKLFQSTNAWQIQPSLPTQRAQHSSNIRTQNASKVRHNSTWDHMTRGKTSPFLLHLHPTRQQQNPHKNHAQCSPPACLATDRHCKTAAARFFGCPRTAFPLPPWVEALLLASAAAADNASALLSVNGE